MAGCTSNKSGGGGGGGTPALQAAVSSQPSGNFSSGEQGASYTITVKNSGTAATSGTVTVVDPPTGFTVVTISGTGWTCTVTTVTCTNSTSLGAGQSFPPITVTGNVTAGNGSTVSIPLMLSGGGISGTVTATPTINVTAVALSITKSHTGNFAQGQTGATYTVKVSNGTAAGTTSGTVTMKEMPPSGLTVTAMAGSSWTCSVTTLTCTRSDQLTGGTSYSTITVTVNVATNAGPTLINQVSVSGGNQSGTVTASDSTTIVVPPALAISKTANGTFTQGEVGATYTVTVSNGTSAGATNGSKVEVTEAPPTGMTVTKMAGTGWTCPGTGGANTCDRSDVLAAGSSYPTITVTVTVYASATSPQVNMASVSGGGSATASTSVSTVIVAAAVLSISKTANGTFVQGGTGTYTVTVSNLAGHPATSGTVTVTEMPPSGLTVTAIAGTNWTCSVTTLTCTRSDALAGGASYDAITVTVTISATATSPQVNMVSVLGGGSANASGQASTTIMGAPVLSITKTHSGNFTQGQTGATYTVKVSNGATAGPTSGTVTVTEMPPSGLTVTAIAGTNWTCSVTTLTCTRSDALNGGQSYDTITVTVTVAASASSPQVNMVKVSGGGSATATGSDSTTIGSSGPPSCPLPMLGNESLLNNTYSALFNGWKDSPVGPTQAAAAFKATGTTGTIPSGETDTGSVGVGVAQVAPVKKTFTGCFNLGADERGLMIWNFSGGGSVTFAIAVRSDGTLGQLIEFDDADPATTPGTRGSGYFEKQVPITATNASVAFEFTGYAPNGGDNDYRRSGAIGVIGNLVLGGSAANGTADVAFTNDGTGTQANVDNQAFTATLGVPDSLGRGTATINFPNFALSGGPLTLHFAYYEADPGRLFLQSTDAPDNSGHSLENGEIIPQTSVTFSNASVSTAVFQMSGADLSSNHAYTEIAVGRIVNSSGAVTFDLDDNRGGNVIAIGAHGIPNGTINISANGMGSITIGSCTCFSSAPAPFSVAMYGPNAGFILEGTQASVPSPSTILIGDFQPQTTPSGGFVNGSFSGLYIIGVDHPTSTDSDNFVGSINANPNSSPPSFTGTDDTSSLAGCMTNCLSADQAFSATYSIDVNGRETITLGSGTGGGTIPGWLIDTKNAVILSDTSSANATVIKAHQ
jgi:uncharacterized repeat protein (TIGR01451 family)